MAGPDLEVDLGMLSDIATELGLLIEEFGNCEAIADGAAGGIGSPKVAGAVSDFASNWRVHRHDLIDAMQAVRDMADKSHDTYVAVDEQLASDISTSADGAGGPR